MKFKGEIWKTGNSFVVTVPAQFVNNGALEQGKTYEFDAIEVASNVSE